MAAVGCFDRTYGWRSGQLHSTGFYGGRGGSTGLLTTDLFGSAFQPRPLPQQQHHHQQQNYQAAAFASLLHHVAPPAATALMPSYFQVPQLTSPESEKPIGCGAFGVVWAVRDPRDGRRIAVKKLPNVFQSLVSCRRVYRELKMLCCFDHENVLSAIDILHPPDSSLLGDIYVATELMQSDLHRIIVSQQPLTTDHVKIFLYQILRGLKYLHSANILHRDIKPGNLLVNSNCLLKICYFGLARIAEPDDDVSMTREVVTQYYRAPEILMGARHYTSAVDVWSVGCVLAELLSRHILFQANGPMQQLDLIVDVLGAPTVDDLTTASDAAKQHMLRRARRQPDHSVLYSLSADCNHEVVDLLCRLLVFNPERRITAADALFHPYLEDGRLRYHSCMCRCCHRVAGGRTIFTDDAEPCHPQPFDFHFEQELSTVSRVRDKLFSLCREIQHHNAVSLALNTTSSALYKLTQSQYILASEMLPSPRLWD
jgi:nemo like kinase